MSGPTREQLKTAAAVLRVIRDGDLLKGAADKMACGVVAKWIEDRVVMLTIGAEYQRRDREAK